MWYYIENTLQCLLAYIRKQSHAENVPSLFAFLDIARVFLCHFVCCYCLLCSPSVINVTPSFMAYTLSTSSSPQYPYAITSPNKTRTREKCLCKRRQIKFFPIKSEWMRSIQKHPKASEAEPGDHLLKYFMKICVNLTFRLSFLLSPDLSSLVSWPKNCNYIRRSDVCVLQSAASFIIHAMPVHRGRVGLPRPRPFHYFKINKICIS